MKLLIQLKQWWRKEEKVKTVFDADKINHEKIDEWLANSWEVRGARDYLKLREARLLESLAVHLEQREYDRKVGMVEEIRAMATNMEQAWKRRQESKGR